MTLERALRADFTRAVTGVQILGQYSFKRNRNLQRYIFFVGLNEKQRHGFPQRQAGTEYCQHFRPALVILTETVKQFYLIKFSSDILYYSQHVLIWYVVNSRFKKKTVRVNTNSTQKLTTSDKMVRIKFRIKKKQVCQLKRTLREKNAFRKWDHGGGMADAWIPCGVPLWDSLLMPLPNKWVSWLFACWINKINIY